MADPSTAAPGRLELVRVFVNTRDIELSTDALGSPAELHAWLRENSLMSGSAPPTAADLRRATRLRESLRAALLANHDEQSVPRNAQTALNDAAARADIRLTLNADSGWVARPRAPGVDGAVGELVVVIADAMRDGTWRRLKACVNDTCQWAFYDHSRARSGKWCSMQICGNRAKQQTWRARHD